MTMDYRDSVTSLMRRRFSCRSYLLQPLGPEVKGELLASLRRTGRSPFGHEVCFRLMEKPPQAGLAMRLGTYGMIKNPGGFLLGTIQESPRAYESYGFLFEQVILKATELGLATCWLGYFRRGTFLDPGFGKEGEILPAISPVGYPSESRGLYDRFVQQAVKPRSRKPWEALFFLAGFRRALAHGEAGDYEEALEMVRIAPSSGNLQPWRVVKERGREVFHFFLDHAASRKGYEQRGLPHIDLGIAMCHFELAAREKNLCGRWMESPPRIASLMASVEYIASWEQQ